MTQSSDEVQLVVFRLGDAEFAFNIFQVERVLRHQAPEPLPNAPPFLEGLLPYGDGVVPVFDLRKRVGAPAPLSDETRTIIVELEQGRVGVVVSGKGGSQPRSGPVNVMLPTSLTYKLEKLAPPNSMGKGGVISAEWGPSKPNLRFVPAMLR